MNNNNIIQLQQQYIANWHDSFVNGVTKMQNLIASVLAMQNVTAQDKQGLELCQLILDGKDVRYIEKSLREGMVSRDMLDKIEKLGKDMVDVAIRHLQSDIFQKEFLKQLAYFKIEQDKQAEVARLRMIGIVVINDS